MKLPISKRLLACADFVRQGAYAADVGADHGYLGIYLLQKGIAVHVTASDLREKPIERARQNAERFGTADRMDFFCCDGLQMADPLRTDTVICAGMGSDCIIDILNAAPWIRRGDCRLVLQPQSSGQDLRRYLAENGFELLRERLVEDGGFLYNVLEVCHTGMRTELTPGEQFVSPMLRESGDSLLPRYLSRLRESMKKTVAGLRSGGNDPEKLMYYETALREIGAWEDDNSK